MFDAVKVKNECVAWIRDFFAENGPACCAVVGISGGKDRSAVAALCAVSQCFNGRVANTCNLSEDFVGYSTRYGDAAGDFSPCAHLTVQEVKAVGRVLGLPDVLVDKVPIDGLCGKTDEENLGFTYAELDRYIRTGEIENQAHRERIDTLHKRNLFKLRLMPAFDPHFPEA